MKHRIFAIRMAYPEGLKMDEPIVTAQVMARVEQGRDVPKLGGTLGDVVAKTIQEMSKPAEDPNRLELVLIVLAAVAHAKANLSAEQYRIFCGDLKDTLSNPYNNLHGMEKEKGD